MRRSTGWMILLTGWGLLMVARCAAPLVMGPPSSQPGHPVSLTLPNGWTSVAPPGSRAIEVSKSWTVSGQEIRGHVVVATEQRLSHDEAVRRLVEIAAEMAAPPTYTVVGGWPALVRRATVEAPTIGEAAASASRQPPLTMLTTAVAAADLVVRAEGSISTSAPSSAPDEIEALASQLVLPPSPDPAQTQKDIQRLRGAQLRASEIAPLAPPASVVNAPRLDGRLGAAVVGGSNGEIEVAASRDGHDVVIASNGGIAFSRNGGVTFSSFAGFPAANNGDPSLTVGASGTFFLSFIGRPGGACASTVASSTAAAGAFSVVGNASFCPTTGNPQCFPDQEHIAADPMNLGPTGKDQLYVVWRLFTPAFGGNCPTSNLNYPTPMISCSSDGGATWTSPIEIAPGDWPRVTVGDDGSVWVVQRAYSSIAVNKFSSCRSGLMPQPGFPRLVSTVNDVQCPVPGLNRCNNGNSLSSHTIAVDHTDPNHIFVAWATGTGNGNEDIVVADSVDGGVNWPRSVRVNTPTTARRYLPWLCTSGAVAHVGWYDRRAAVGGATNDLTAYFTGSASVTSGSLSPGTEVNISVSNDPQCSHDWIACGERDSQDADSCTVRQFDGTCLSGGVRTGATCDPDQPACGPGQFCQGVVTGGGCPIYGDYNGGTCAAGHFFSAWASATPPPGIAASSGMNVYVDPLPCGVLGGPCCTSGTSCGTGMICQSPFCVACGAGGEPCCNGGACIGGLTCNSAQQCQTVCGGAGQACCAGNSCTPGAVCSAGSCVSCPPPALPQTVFQTDQFDGNECGGRNDTFTYGTVACDPGFSPSGCTATRVSDPNDSTCAVVSTSGCSCTVRIHTPQDCSKWIKCRVKITETSNAPRPAGCP